MASQTKKAQPTISAYFSQAAVAPPPPKGKRAAAPIDLTVSDEEDVIPTPKRPKLFDSGNRGLLPITTPLKGPFATPLKSRTAKATATTRPLLESPVSKYVYHASPGATNVEDEDMPSQKEIEARDARREAFRRKLGSQFERKDSNALQIAEEDQSYEIDGGDRGAPSSEPDEDSDVQEVEPAAMSKKLSAFAATSSKGASSSKAKTTSSKAPVKSRTKKVDEVGPSGLKFTPLEKQASPRIHYLPVVRANTRLTGSGLQEGASRLSLTIRSWLQVPILWYRCSGTPNCSATSRLLTHTSWPVRLRRSSSELPVGWIGTS